MPYAILKLKEVPKSCIDCPCEYDSIYCQAIEDSEKNDFTNAMQKGIDVWYTRLPDCPLKICEDVEIYSNGNVAQGR